MHLFSDPVSILEPDVLQSPNKLFQQSFNERIAWQPHSTYMPINEISSMLPNPEPRAFLVASGLTVQLSERCIGFETNLEHTPIKITYCIFTGTWHFQLDPKDDRMSLALLWLGVSVRFRCHKSLTTWQLDTRKKKCAEKIAQWRRMICRLKILAEVDVTPLSCAPDFVLFMNTVCLQPAYAIRAYDTFEKMPLFSFEYFFPFFFLPRNNDTASMCVWARVQCCLEVKKFC